MLSVSVLSVPRCAAATLLLLIVTVGDGLAPAVDSVVVTPRKTVEPRFNQRKKCVETDDAHCTLPLSPTASAQGNSGLVLLLVLLLLPPLVGPADSPSKISENRKSFRTFTRGFTTRDH